MKTTLIAAALVGTSLACEGGCEVTLCEHRQAGGWCDSWGEGTHNELGWYNDRASSMMVDRGCTVEIYEHTNLRGRKVTMWSNHPGAYLDLHSAAFPINLEDKVSSLKVYPTRRRRRSSADASDADQARDPLCEWILEDGINGNWGFGDSKEATDEEVAKLLEECEGEFREGERLDQCKFYVHAAAAFYDDAELVADLKFDPAMETLETEYMRCGVVANKINDAIEEGKLSGIKLSKGSEGAHDTFILETPAVNKHPVFVENEGAVATIMSVGAMISLAVSNVLVKVCRDFDPVDGHFLL